MNCNKTAVPIFLLVLALLPSCREVTEYYSKGFQQEYARPISLMMSREFDALNLSGQGIRIGVIDAGFGEFRTNPYTKDLLVLGCRDFVDNDTTGFFINESNHGTAVTKNIGGKNEGKVHGLAYQAGYYLAKTDLPDMEPKQDEIRLLRAIEWMIEEKVDVINISLGYTVFTDGSAYESKILDGKTALSSRFIDSVLVLHPDLIVVISAGNEGDKVWRHITVPSDVKDAITVGSTDFDGKSRWESSGIGKEDVPYPKPDVATYPTPTGNSYTAPVVAGLCAALLEYKRVDRIRMKALLTGSGNHAANPDLETGYGVPQTGNILEKLQTD